MQNAFEFCFVSFFIKNSKQNVIASILEGTFSHCVTFKTCNVLQVVTEYSGSFVLYLFTVPIISP